MKYRLTTIGLALVAALGQVQAQDSIELKEADHKLIPYGKKERQVLHLWLPETKTPAALVMHYHGGGFLGGDIRKKTQSRIAAICNAAGIAYADVEYRLLNQAMLHEIMRDCSRAVQFLRHNAKKYNLDKTRVGAYGESAGAGASLWMATKDDLADPKSKDPVLRESSRLTAAAGFWVQATYDIVQWPKILDLPPEKTPYWGFLKFWKPQLSEERFNELRKDLDMLGNMDKGDPPMMFTPGKQDKSVHSQRFVDALEKRAKEAGASLIIEDERKELIQFMFAKLKTKPKQVSGTQSGGKPVRKPFPQNWGDPPAIQTQDYRKLPGAYGFGSSTLANWIQEKLDNDSKK